MLNQRNGPFLQSFLNQHQMYNVNQQTPTYWQHGMISIEKSISDDRPGYIPWKFFVVEKNTHQLGNSKRGVRLRNFQVGRSKNDTNGLHR